jgi:hypothetical protein
MAPAGSNTLEGIRIGTQTMKLGCALAVAIITVSGMLHAGIAEQTVHDQTPK